METIQMYKYLLLKVIYGSHSPTKDFSTLKSMQYTTTAKASKNTIKTLTPTTVTNQSTSQQQHFLVQQQHITAEEQQLQQQKIAKPNVIKTPATHAATSEEQQQQQQQLSEEDVDPVISPTTKEETAEKFIGGHSTPQVSMDPNTAAEVETSTSSTPANAAAAPIPKQRSLFVAPIKLLSTEEPDSCTNSSSATATSTTRLTSSTSSGSPTATMVAAAVITKEQQQQQQQQLKQQKIVKGKLEKLEPATPTEAELHEAVKEEEELLAETTTTITTTTGKQHTHSIKSICGTYSSSPSTTLTATLPPPPPPPLLTPPTTTAFVGKSTTGTTTGLGSSCGSSHIQSYSSNESEKSFTATTTFGTNALLSTTTCKKFDIDKFEKTSPKISTKLQSNQFIKNQAAVSNNSAGAGGATTKYIKYRSTQDSNDCSQATKTTANAAIIKKKMVAVQEMKKTTTTTTTNSNHHIGTTTSTMTTTCSRQSAQSHTVADFDASEDLSYGPGIVSKLRCRYLSLALRESMEKQRHALDTLRRATSLNNLLDRDDQLRKHADEDEEEEEEEGDAAVNGDDVNVADDYGEDQENLPPRPTSGGILRGPHDSQQANVTKKTATFQKYASAANAHARMSQSQGDGGGHLAPGDTNNSNNKRSRHIKRGNDSLKRARSVEALLCEKSPWNFAYNRSSLEPPRPTCNRGGGGATINVTIEDKINNARERLVLGTDVMPPRRLTSIIDDTERPPPDLVKQTLKKFEATANRRGRGVNRAQGNGDVANKVANYCSIIKEQKPAIVFPKPPAPPLSPTKKVAVKLSIKAPVLGAADLIGSPIGRKTAAVAATTSTAIATAGSPLSSGFPLHAAETSTPKQKLQPVAADVLAFTASPPLKNVTALSSVGVVAGLSENSPDIIPRHNIKKLLSETAVGAVAAVDVDSPVTALTKKLEKLRIDADKQAQHVTAKEFQAKPNQQQLQQQKQEQQHDLTAGSDKFVGGDAAPLSATTDKHHNSNGTRSKNNKNKSIGCDDDDGDSDKDTNDNDGGDESDDVRDDYDFIHDRCAEAESVKAGTGSASSDLSDDEYGTVTKATTTKRVSKKALDNIAKAGTSQEFKFATTTTTTTELLKTTATGKQIGVIRPLHQLPASSSSSSSSSSCSSSTYSSSSNSSNESFTVAKSSTNNNTNNQHQQQQHMETLRNHQQQTYTLSHTSNTYNTSTHTHTHAHHHHPALTSREIEKNRINEMKKTATVVAAATSNAAAATDIATAAPTTTTIATTSLDTVIVTGGSSSSSSSKVSSLSELDAAATITHNSSPLWALQTKKKRQPPAVVAENNSMVFNFSNRKEVPDYIENDGVVIRRKRELPKPNESGFVLLGDLSLETSTDSDYDDFSLCPPSPCDVEFENANIVIDGKSSIRQKPKEASFRVQFNDTLTSTFEYPSEASLVVDDSISDRYANENFVNSYENLVLEPTASITQTDSPKHHHHVAVDEIIPIPINSTTGTTNNSTPTTKMLGSLPLGSAPLGCYTPVKAPIDNLFQLGVTRAPNGNGISHNTIATTTTATNGNGTTTAPTTNGGNNGDSSNILSKTPTTNDEPESLQYLKPANDDLTIAYSEGAQKTDLLY